jgi:hypothetical protein
MTLGPQAAKSHLPTIFDIVHPTIELHLEKLLMEPSNYSEVWSISAFTSTTPALQQELMVSPSKLGYTAILMCLYSGCFTASWYVRLKPFMLIVSECACLASLSTPEEHAVKYP